MLFLPKCNDFCRLCFCRDRSSTYDSLTSYYNRIGVRFYDIGKWDQLNEKSNLKLTTNQIVNSNNSFQLNSIRRIESQHSDQSNSLIVKEIPFNPTSRSSSLTTITTEPHQTSNGLIVTTKRNQHL